MGEGRVVRVRGEGRGRRVRGVRRRWRPPRRRGSLCRQTSYAATDRRLELTCAACGELLERRRVALREVQFRLHNRRGRRQWPRGLRVRPPSLRRVRVHVVVDMFLHLGFGGEAATAVWHRTTERPVALVSPRVLI